MFIKFKILKQLCKKESKEVKTTQHGTVTKYDDSIVEYTCMILNKKRYIVYSEITKIKRKEKFEQNKAVIPL